MKYFLLPVFILSLLLVPLNQAGAQSNVTTTTADMAYKSSELLQWVKDMRRFDIIAFGMFPFSMFFATFVTDMVRWKIANNFDMSEQGRRYAPWPLKSAGAVEMTTEEYNRTILIAAGVSATIALVDMAIVLIRRNSERRRAESMPTSSFEISTSPYGIDPDAEDHSETVIDEDSEQDTE